MKRKVHYLLALSIASILSCLFVKSKKVEASSDVELMFDKNYYVNEYFKLPENTISKDGKEYLTDCYITYPNGGMYKKEEITFEDAGLYKVTYIAKENSSIQESYDFKVLDRKYHFSSNTYVHSSATYGVDSSVYNTGIEGLTVKLYAGETFYYDELIDLNECQDDGTCDFFKFFALPETVGKMDLERFHIRLTDSVDEKIYLDIYVFPYPVRKEPEEVPLTTDENWKYFDTFIQVGGQNQIPTGCDWKADGSCSINKGNLSGFSAAHSMYGYSNYYNGYDKPRVCTVGKEILNMGLNLETLEFNSTHRIGGRSSVVCDLDDVTIMEEPWTGFTSGKVKMSIEGYMYRDSANIPFTFMITKLGNNDLSIGDVIDNEGPTISIEENEDPCYVNNYYKVPTYIVEDDKSKIKSSNVSVYYNYNSSTQYELEIEDGYFKPDKKGIYTIEYTAKDYFNNESIYKYRINAIDGNPSDYEIEILQDNFTVEVGNSVEFQGFSSTALVEYSKVLTKDGAVIEFEDNSYKFTSPGTYKLTYSAIDSYNNKKEKVVTYNVTGNIKPVFEDVPILPEYYVEGATYSTPTLNAIDYNNGLKYVSSICSIDLGEGYEIVTDNNFKVEAKTNDLSEINVRFIASNEYGTSTISYSIPYVNIKNSDNQYDLSNLFKGSNINAIATKDYIEVSSSKINKETYFDLVNPLNAEDLSLTFKINPSKSSFDSLDIIFTDSEDSNCKLMFTMKKNGENGSLFEVNGIDYSIQAGFKNDTSFTLSYSNITQYLKSSEFSLYINKDINGDLFEGFKSGLCYVRFRFNNVVGGASVILTKINAQSLSNTTMDYVKPTIITNGEYASSYKYGEEITIFKSKGVDVIDASPTTTLTIRQQDGNQIYDVNNLLMSDVSASKEYKVKLNYYGTYIVSYTSIDASNRKNQYMYSFEVIDDEGPRFNVISQELTVNINEAVDISNIKVSDNVDENITYSAYIIYPNFEYKTLENNVEGLKFTSAGIYYVRFIALDSANNLSAITYKIIVNGR